MQIERAAGGYDIALFGRRIGLDGSRTCEDDTFGLPASRIAGTPTREWKSVFEAPSFKGFEVAADRLVVEKSQRLAVVPVCGRERVTILTNGSVLCGHKAAACYEIGFLDK